MVDDRVAIRYARALYQAAAKSKIVDAVQADLDGIADLLEAQPKFKALLVDPEVSRKEKLGLMERLFADRTTALTMQALRLLLDKRRQDCIDSVRNRFADIRREHDSVLKVDITAAEALSEMHEKAIITKIQTATGKRVDATVIIDPSLMGGVTVAYSGYVLDGSIKGNLARLRETLVYDLLKQN